MTGVTDDKEGRRRQWVDGAEIPFGTFQFKKSKLGSFDFLETWKRPRQMKFPTNIRRFTTGGIIIKYIHCRRPSDGSRDTVDRPRGEEGHEALQD